MWPVWFPGARRSPRLRSRPSALSLDGSPGSHAERRVRERGDARRPFELFGLAPFGRSPFDFARGFGIRASAFSSGSSCPSVSHARVHAVQRVAPPLAFTTTPPHSEQGSGSGCWFSVNSQSG